VRDLAEPARALAAIIVNYRTPDETLAAVASLRASRRRPDPIIVVDNGSGDGSPERIAAAEPGAKLMALGQNLGYSAGANVALRVALEAGAQTVLLLTSDARVAPDCVARLEAEAARPGVGIAGPTVLRLDQPDIVDSLGIRYAPWTGRMRVIGAGGRRPARPDVRAVDALAGTVLCVRRAVFDAAGLFDPAYFFYYEDLDLCLRARRAGFASVLVGDAVAWHRGAASVGPRSPARGYWATRGQLRLAARARPLPAPLSALRAVGIVAMNAAHLVVRRPAPLGPGARAIGRAVWHHLRDG
jgi:GT2 family glycosyltransferase